MLFFQLLSLTIWSVFLLLQEDSSYNRIKTLVNEELKQYFRPEFLNRLVRPLPHFWKSRPISLSLAVLLCT